MITKEQAPPNNSLPTIQPSIALHDKNWFGTGGQAQWYSEPTSAAAFQHAIHYANRHTLPMFILGAGANILISDTGFHGLVIRPTMDTITIHEFDDYHCLVEAAAGVSFADLISFCLDNQLKGLEEFSGIPGTVGGSVFINIHYFEFLLSTFLVQAQVIDRSTGEISTVDTHWFSFGYDYSTLHTQNHYLISATFKLKKCSVAESAYARGRRDEIIRHRHQRYPYLGTCGSFFRNFNQDEVTNVKAHKKLIFVAYYLDKLGVKGELAVGDAIVSYKHANMIVNQGHATSHDIITLARTMQELVYNHFGIIPQPECQLIGFKQYPLL